MSKESTADTSAPTSLFDCHPWPRTIGLVVFATVITAVAGMKFQRDHALEHYHSQEQQINMLTERNQSLTADRHTLLTASFYQQQLLRERDERLAQQDVEMNLLEERMDSVEIAMGIQDAPEAEALESRVDTAAINTAMRATMLRLIPSGQPIESFRRSSGFGKRVHPVTGEVRSHLGLDLTADIGTPIYAPADGVIEQVRRSRSGYGNMVRMQHAFGFTTVYAHLDDYTVKAGEFVNKGQLIAYSGNSGLSTGPHLHYEVRFLGRALNPKSFINWAPDNFDSLFQKEKSIAWSSMIDVIAESMTLPVQLTQGSNGTPALAVHHQIHQENDEG
ncbi:M23 family metallopeptidase [Thaumasiovibrio subtropicus]|uniref:M23 family metallopeptidase n=1 Tax=Thaumasiovibrio subtropicus TaxID=1891207 RepID=UPI000B34BF13|nr:M23 family metallopeptidase [Thaumasiovibrio subtropicus]